MRFKFRDEINPKFEELLKKLNETSGKQEVSLDILCDKNFMKKYTTYDYIYDFLDASPVKIETNDDFEKIDMDKLDSFVRENSNFKSFDDMIGKAGEEYLMKEIFG